VRYADRGGAEVGPIHGEITEEESRVNVVIKHLNQSQL
jgi:hypothetical protein